MTKSKIVEEYRGFVVQEFEGKYYASLGGAVFVTPDGKGSHFPRPYDTIEAARAAIDNVNVTIKKKEE